MKNYALICTTALLTIAFLLIWDSPPESFLKQSEGRPEKIPLADSYMRQVRARVFSLDGKEQFSMQSPQIKFFRNVSEIFISSPNVTSRENSGRKVEISAKSALLNQINYQIELSGNVRINAGLGNNRAMLETEKLTYFPDEGLVVNDREFVFKNNIGKVFGVGIEAYPDRGDYRFLAQVKGIYEDL